MQLFSADATIFKKKKKNFAPQNIEKPQNPFVRIDIIWESIMSESESHSTVFTEGYMVTSTEYLVSEVVKLDTVTQALQSKVSTVS